MPKTLMLMRHAEKPTSDPSSHGISGSGLLDGESLTPLGWQRARALVGFFVGSMGGAGTSGLPVPTHLFASQVGPQSSSRRPLETVQPLSERLGLLIDTRFRKEEIDLLARALLALQGQILVAWEHHLIPSLAMLLTATPSLVPTLWPDDRFDVVWVFEADAGETALGFRQVTERLLAGDSASPIDGPSRAL